MSLTTLQSSSNEITFLEQKPVELEASHWQNTANRRRGEINDLIPDSYKISPTFLKGSNHVNLVETCGVLNSRELSILKLSATKLLELIHNQTFTSVEVATAFCKSAAIAHQATNCLAWVLFRQCLEDAADLDNYMKKYGKPKGPLHGLPISVKEHIFLHGTPSTSGFVAWSDDFSDTDALIVKLLREAGAIFHVKTTNPQGLMALETVSNLYGTTNNPYNTHLTPGGSSGGEAALIAMRGSLLGIGTDIGGSIRVPSAFCGLYGIKPSVARLPHGGLSGAHSGMENIIGVVGPMATCIDDLRLFCKIVLAAEPWLYEPSLVEMQWKETPIVPKSLKIGVMWHDGLVQPHPPIMRCLRETVASLEKDGHTIINWDPALHSSLVECIDQAYLLDGGAEYHEILAAGNEPASPLMKWILEKGSPKEHTVSETWTLNTLRNALQTAYAAQWNEAGIDCLLCPVNASVASAHGESTYWGYSSAFNSLDYSAAVFPVGSVQEGDAKTSTRSREEYMSEQDAIFEGYYSGSQKYKDAPVSLQLVTRRYREEQLLRMVEKVVESLSEGGSSSS